MLSGAFAGWGEETEEGNGTGQEVLGLKVQVPPLFSLLGFFVRSLENKSDTSSLAGALEGIGETWFMPASLCLWQSTLQLLPHHLDFYSFLRICR